MGKLKLEKVDAKKLIISGLLIIALVLQFSFLSFLFKAVAPEDKKEDENVIMSYTSTGNINYNVYLKPNEFIKKEFMGPGEAYILDLIDHIKLNYSYKFDATEKTKVGGNSKLIIKLKAYYRESSSSNGNPEILNKEKTIDQKVINFEDQKYNSFGTYDLYLGEYLETLKSFQSQVKISVDGYIEISYETNLNGSVGGASYNNKYDSTLKIPLSTSVIKIEASKAQPKTDKVYEGDLVKTNKTVMGYIIVANIVVFLIVCLLLKKLFMFTNKSLYEVNLNKILKNYDDIIVNTTSVLDVSKYKLIEINEFKEILNLSRELLLPIMNYEVIKGKETWFYVVKDDILYRFVISDENLKKKEEKNKKQKSK